MMPSARRLSAMRLLAAVAALAAALSTTAHAAVSASLDSNSVAPGDTVQLRLERDGQANVQPDLTPLRKNFDILGTSRSSSFQIINGQTSSSTDIVVTLAPKRSGRLKIPPITWGTDRSPALVLNVGAGASSAAAPPGTATGLAAKVFLATKFSPPRPYVQGAVQVTVSLYTAETLYQADLELPAGDNALVQQVGGDEHGTANRNGRSYRVLTRHYVVFPQRSGVVDLPGPVLSAQIARAQNGSDPFFGNDPFGGLFGGSQLGGALLGTRPIRVHGKPLTLHVRPRPAGVTTSYWLPAHDVALTSKWNPKQLKVHVGDPLTVDLHVQAEGLTAAQLPDLSALLKVPAGLKEYPDKAKLSNVASNGTVLGNRDQSIALIADRAGHYTLPAVTVHWWDTKADQPRATTLPARTLMILPAAGQSATSPPTVASVAPARKPQIAPAHTATGASPAAGSASAGGREIPWRWISFGAVLLWLATLAAWFFSQGRTRSTARRGHERAPRDSRAKRPDPRATFREACRRNDAPAARRALLDWAAAIWPDAPPAGLNALAERLEDGARAAALRALDRACYAGVEWQGENFASALGDLAQAKPKAAGRSSELEPLYP